jgi:predicted SprT family Zn-dependent metalloprotease
MKATIEYIQRKFDEYNQQMFRGSLKPLPIQLSRARTYLGQIAFKRRRTLTGGWHYHDFIFRISTLIDMPEQLVEDTILHEMIHYYIFSNQIKDTAPHGKVFRRIMNEINTRYGRNITVSHRRTSQEREADVQDRQHFVCAVRFTDGEWGMVIPVKTRLFYFWDALQRVPRIAEQKWYVSRNPYFNRFPRVQTLKTYRVTQAELEELLKTAKPLVRQGDTIMIAKQ